MRITLTHDIAYSLRIFRHSEGGVNPRIRENLGTLVSWCAAAPGDRRPKASMRDWYYATTRQRSICAYVPIAPRNMVGSRTHSWLGFEENAQIGWVYCTWSAARRWCKKGSDYEIQQRAERALATEARDYEAYIDGDIYRYMVFADKVRWHRPLQTVVASGSGFLGSEPEFNGMLETFPQYLQDAFHNYSMYISVHV